MMKSLNNVVSTNVYVFHSSKAKAELVALHTVSYLAFKGTHLLVHSSVLNRHLNKKLVVRYLLNTFPMDWTSGQDYKNSALGQTSSKIILHYVTASII